jgi:ABC-type Fe3+/spermidine/putrescine transport system ATPase subunit
MAMNEIHLRIENVHKTFGKTKALDSVSLDIARGSFTTFLGPSGCGKTTLLRMIAGFYEVEHGNLYMGDRLINDVPSHLRNAVMVFQDYALFPHMTIRENITYGLRIQKMTREDIEKRLQKTIGYLGIEALLDRTPGQISGGQQQRVALARALVMEPEILLLDEPLSNLDAKLRINIRAELRQLQRRLKITTIYVTHDQAEALSLSDRIAVMNEGKIVQYGSPFEIYYRPRNTFVASFVGIVNLMKGKVASSSSRTILVSVGGEPVLVVPADKEAERTYKPGDDITLCVRPETIRLESALRGQGNGENVFRGRVVNSIFEGSSVRYWIESLGMEFIVDIFDPGNEELNNKDVSFRINPERIHILPT